MPLRDPFDGHCVTDPDPRMSDDERARIVGEQYTTSRYVLVLDETPGQEVVEVWAGCKLTDQHARRVLAAAMRKLMT